MPECVGILCRRHDVKIAWGERARFVRAFSVWCCCVVALRLENSVYEMADKSDVKSVAAAAEPAAASKDGASKDGASTELTAEQKAKNAAANKKKREKAKAKAAAAKAADAGTTATTGTTGPVATAAPTTVTVTAAAASDKDVKSAAPDGSSDGKAAAADAKDSKDSKDGGASGDAKKKKKKKKPAAAGEGGAAVTAASGGDSKSGGPKKQTSPCTIPVMDLFPDHKYPVGEMSDHPGVFNTFRVTSAEKKALDRVSEEMYNEIREAAEVHRQVRMDLQKWLKPGVAMLDVVKYVPRTTYHVQDVQAPPHYHHPPPPPTPHHSLPVLI